MSVLELREAADAVRARTGANPSVAVIAGSGFGGLAAGVREAVSIGYDELPGVPRIQPVAGQAGRLVVGLVGGVQVVVFSGRLHLYQGVSARDAAFPARLAAPLGCSVLVITNAAGGVSERFCTGDIALIRDHLNLTGQNPLVGWEGPQKGTPFVSMSGAYDAGLRALSHDTAHALNLTLKEGVYAGMLGPSYETPAEVEMLRRLGADMVGMSTVPEVIAGRALGLRVLGLSLITNAAAGEGLSHDEVLDIGSRAADRVGDLLVGILRALR